MEQMKQARAWMIHGGLGREGFQSKVKDRNKGVGLTVVDPCLKDGIETEALSHKWICTDEHGARESGTHLDLILPHWVLTQWGPHIS